MRTAVLLLLCLGLNAIAFTQCPDFQLVDLQSLQRGSDAQKKNHFHSLGFDLDAKSGNSLRYNKCWKSNRNGKAIFDQVIYWNLASGDITFLTPDEAAFLALRKSIEGRHGQTGTLGASDVYIGQVFRYKFGSQWLDGVMHWSVAITFK